MNLHDRPHDIQSQAIQSPILIIHAVDSSGIFTLHTVSRNGNHSPPHSIPPSPPAPIPHHLQAPPSISTSHHTTSSRPHNIISQIRLAYIFPRCSICIVPIVLCIYLLPTSIPPSQHNHPLCPATNSMDSRAHGKIQPYPPTRSCNLDTFPRPHSVREKPKGSRDGNPKPKRHHCG